MEIILHPKSEIDGRIWNLQQRMGDLTGVILFQSVDMCYFSGTAQEGLVYVSRDSQPIVMIRKSQERAEQESPLEIRPLKSFKTLKTDLGIPQGGLIGLELDVLPYNNYLRIERALLDAEFLDISETIKQIRSVKSEFEIKLIRRACEIVDAGIASIENYLREGIREIELAGKVEAEMRAFGHEGIIHFRRFNHELHFGHIMSGPDAAVPSYIASPTGGRGVSVLHAQGAGFKKIKRNEPVLVDYAGVYNGYISDETRIFSIGKIDRTLEDAHHAALEIQTAIAKELKHGRSGRDIFRLSEDEGMIRGYEEKLGGPPGAKCGFVGHGVGLEIDEYPVLGPVDHEIRSNMTIAVEPKMIYPGVGVVGIEDTFLTNMNGAERLTRLPQEIWRL
ncbi:MAG: Xaa-Pro peptidase family protein [Methanotrichaceae archaeon]|nr:Xaa-Pro peptidase family protein [Methanotrichaceae archaeon]